MQQLIIFPPPHIYMVQIVLERLGDAAPRQKILYVGLLTTIASLRMKGETVTSTRLADYYGHEYSSMTKMIKVLVEAGIVKQTLIPNREGRGRAYELSFNDTPELRDLLGIGTGPLP
jgi:DNA-binding MarR family transcriptional regulator